MPKGKGTYGKKRGRPPLKKKVKKKIWVSSLRVNLKVKRKLLKENTRRYLC